MIELIVKSRTWFFSVITICISLVTHAQVDTLLLCDPSDVVQLLTEPNKFTYSWNPSSTLDNPSIHNPIASPVVSTLYVVESIDEIIGENLIINPDFSEGNVGFNSDYPFSERIFTQGLYGVTDSAAKLNGIFFTDCPDHTDGSGLMMVVDGAPTAGLKVWCQTIEVKPNTQYAFSTWLSSVLGSNPAQLQFSINDEPLGFIFTAIEEVCQWRQFFEFWQSSDTTTAEICIVNRNTDPNGNDFALDDFLFVEIGNLSYDSTLVVIEDFHFNANISQLPDCGEANGVISVNPRGFGGRLQYSIDGNAFTDERIISEIENESYQLLVRDVTTADSDFNVCLFDTTIVVGQEPCPIYIPNSFFRGQDMNGLFSISPHPEFAGVIRSLTIYDRWGSPIFKTEDQDMIIEGWNGTSNSGEALNAGVYGYRVDVSYQNGEEMSYVGDVTIF